MPSVSSLGSRASGRECGGASCSRGRLGRIASIRAIWHGAVRGLSVALSLLGCSAEEGGSTRTRGTDDSPVIDVSQFDNATTARDDGDTCQSGVRSACYCSDGSESGTQTCMAGGVLGLCQGCRSADGVDSGASSAPVVADGALCDALAGQGGCINESFRSEELPASLLFLVDRSGSMLCNPPELGQTTEECDAMASTKDPAQPTKWEITTSALEQVFASLVGSGASAGLGFFSTDDVCGVDSRPTVPVAPVDAGQLTRMVGALGSTHPAGGTPLVGGTILAYAHLYEEAGLDASGGCAKPPCGAPGNRFVVLITDGADSCPSEPTPGTCSGGSCTDFLLDQSVHEALDVNIRTFVIGAPGSESARGFLSELALSGGTARNGDGCAGRRDAPDGDCHFDMTTSTDFARDLSDALDAISGSAIGCEFPVPQLPDRAPSDNVNVQVRAGGNGSPRCLGYDARPCDGGADGWQFGRRADGGDDLARVVLCGEACRAVQSDPAVQVDVVLGCRPLLVE